MLRKSILVTTLLCTSLAWSSQEASDLSAEYINKVTTHLDGLQEQAAKTKAAKEAADTARRDVRAADKKATEVAKELAEANDNTETYPRRIKRDGRSIETKRQESRDIFRNNFPNASTPDEAIRSVNRKRNRLLEDKSVLEGRLRRKNNEFNSSISNAQSRARSIRQNLNSKQNELSNIESQIPQAREDFRGARQEFKKAKALKEDPQLPNKIQRASKRLAELRAERDRRGKKCRGPGSIFRGICNDIRAAKNRLKELQAIAKPGSLKPLRQRKNRAERKLVNLREGKRTLVADTEDLLNELRRADNRVAHLEEDLRIETRPIKNDIADLDDQLGRLQSRLAKAQRLETIKDEIGGLQRRIKRNKDRLAALPALIEQLNADLASAKTILESAQEVQADLNEALDREEAVLPAQRKEINDIRAEMNASVNTITDLADFTEVTPNVETEILPSGDWSVITTDLDNEWNRASCRAETVEVLEETEGEVTSSASLKVVNLVNPTTGFNEPVVVMTVDSSREDLINFNTATMRASSSRTYTFDLIYSKSSKNKLFFMADLKDRKRLIQFMLDKSRMKIKLSSLNADSNEEIRFSLKGSTKALNSRSSRDQSMRNACGGIKVTDI